MQEEKQEQPREQEQEQAQKQERKPAQQRARSIKSDSRDKVVYLGGRDCVACHGGLAWKLNDQHQQNLFAQIQDRSVLPLKF